MPEGPVCGGGSRAFEAFGAFGPLDAPPPMTATYVIGKHNGEILMKSAYKNYPFYDSASAPVKHDGPGPVHTTANRSDDPRYCRAAFFFLLLLLMSVTAPAPVRADIIAPEATFDLSCDGEFAVPGVGCELVLSASGVSDLQYAGLELHFDTTRFAFEQILPGDLPGPEALVIAQALPDGSLGASISSTTGVMNDDGSLIHMRFRIRADAPAGSGHFSADAIEFTDPDGQLLDVSPPESVSAEIPAYLSDAGLLEPGPLTIARGTDQHVRFRLRASGITTDDIDDGARLTAELGIVEAPAPALPADWHQASWLPLTYTGTSDGEYLLEADFPIDQAVGAWQLIGRFQLDDQSPVYAGFSSDGGGIWNGDQYIAPVVTVTAPRVTVAEWTFGGSSWTAGTGLYPNLHPDSPARMTLQGAQFTGWTGGVDNQAPNTNRWHLETDPEAGESGEEQAGGDGETGDSGDIGGNESADGTQDQIQHEKYWSARLAATGYGQLSLRFHMSGSGTGPRDFRLYYRVAAHDDSDGDDQTSSSWIAVPGGDIQVGTSWSEYNLTLPEDASDAGTLLIRWVRTGETSINEGEIGTSGTNRLDDVLVTGVPLDLSEIAVWPGSTSSEGTVSEADVLNLARYWMSTGPERVPRRIEWAPQPVTRWIPVAAGYADTNGDGLVDYRDLLAIGRNFGQTTGTDPQQNIAGQTLSATQTPHDTDQSGGNQDFLPAALVSRTLPRLAANETVRVVLQAASQVRLLGLGTRFSLDLLPPEAWELVEFSPVDWAREWESQKRLIRFHHGRTPATVEGNNEEDGYHTRNKHNTDFQSANSWSAAWAHAGMTDPVMSTDLVAVTIRARNDWETEPVLRLHRITLATADGLVDRPDTEKWKLVRRDHTVDAEREKIEDIPRTTRIHGNYPNPFNPSTTLSFDLHEAGKVRLGVYDGLGRRVATLTDARLDAGTHERFWDASRHASGMYIIRLQTQHTTQTRQIMLVK